MLNNGPLTLGQIDKLLAGPLQTDVADWAGRTLTDRQLIKLVPSLEPVVEVRRQLTEYQRELRAWAERRADERRELIRQQLDETTKRTTGLVEEATARMNAIGGHL